MTNDETPTASESPAPSGGDAASGVPNSADGSISRDGADKGTQTSDNTAADTGADEDLESALSPADAALVRATVRDVAVAKGVARDLEPFRQLAGSWKNPWLQQSQHIVDLLKASVVPPVPPIVLSSQLNDLVKSIRDLSGMTELASLKAALLPSVGLLAESNALAWKRGAFDDVADVAASFNRAGLSPTLFGGLTANAQLVETARALTTTVDTWKLAGLADVTGALSTTEHIRALTSTWEHDWAVGLTKDWQMTWVSGLTAEWDQSIQTREWLLLAASAGLPATKLLSAAPLDAYTKAVGRLVEDMSLALPEDESGLVTAVKLGSPLGFRRLHGRAIDSLVASDALLSPLSPGALDEVVEVVESKVIEPWNRARENVAGELHDRLAAINPKLAELLMGAWDTLDRQGHGYLEATCHLILEALQRTLTACAPDDGVLAWAKENHIPMDEVTASGRVTRRARIRFIYRGRKDERVLVTKEVEAVEASVDILVKRLNAGKHASAGDLTAVRANLTSVESVLIRILG